jgi:YD repeat-containing protein
VCFLGVAAAVAVATSGQLRAEGSYPASRTWVLWLQAGADNGTPVQIKGTDHSSMCQQFTAGMTLNGNGWTFTMDRVSTTDGPYGLGMCWWAKTRPGGWEFHNGSAFDRIQISTCPEGGTVSGTSCSCPAGTVGTTNQCTPQFPSSTALTCRAADEPGQVTPQPIVLAAGTKFYRHVDHEHASPHSLAIDRYYLSRWVHSPMAGLGSHWSHSHSHRVVTWADGVARTVAFGDGQISHFRRVAGSSPVQWVAVGSQDTLQDTAQGMVYRRTQDESTWVFDAGTGRVVSQAGRNGWTYAYAYQSGRLSSVTNAFGQGVTFTYDALGLLASSTGPDGALVSYS